MYETTRSMTIRIAVAEYVDNNHSPRNRVCLLENFVDGRQQQQYLWKQHQYTVTHTQTHLQSQPLKIHQQNKHVSHVCEITIYFYLKRLKHTVVPVNEIKWQ